MTFNRKISLFSFTDTPSIYGSITLIINTVCTTVTSVKPFIELLAALTYHKSAIGGCMRFVSDGVLTFIQVLHLATFRMHYFLNLIKFFFGNDRGMFNN